MIDRSTNRTVIRNMIQLINYFILKITKCYTVLNCPINSYRNIENLLEHKKNVISAEQIMK